MPEGLALAPNGDLYVADTAAQRIRRVTANGTVTTLAGSGALDASRLWVPGGYANGPAVSARFNQPSAVALSPAGGVVVADTGNQCLRVVRDGRVADFAGVCGHAGTLDGTSATAQFEAPIAIEYDSHGTLYVADYGAGVRIIKPDGTVTTLDGGAVFAKDLVNATGLSLYEGGAAPLLFVATRNGVAVYDIAIAKVIQFYKAGVWDPSDQNRTFVAGSRDFGHPYAIAAVGNYAVVYTDLATNAVRFLAGTMTGEAVGSPTENAGFTAGAFRDGEGGEARVDQPMGIARGPSGTFLIADTGNRRIRIMRNLDFRYAFSPSDLAQHRSEYRIAYIGDSIVEYNQSWDESAGGILERRLRANWESLGFPRAPRVFPMDVTASVEGSRDYIDSYLAAGLADMVILQLNSGQVDLSLKLREPSDLVPAATQWQPIVTASLRAVATELTKSGVPFVVVVGPLPHQISPVESGWARRYETPGYAFSPAPPAEYLRFGPLLREAAQAAGVQVIDTFPAFLNEELLPDHPALFGARDWHFSEQGAALNAQVILDDLLRTKPWAATSRRSGS